MPGLHRALAAFLAPSVRPAERGGTRRAEPPLPVREDVLSLRADGGMVGVLEDWRAALHADLGWSRPTREGDVAHRVTTAASALRLNLPWIASSWPPAGAFAEEVHDLERSAVSIVDPPERTMRLGNCAAQFEDGVICGAVLRAVPESKKVRCGWCGTEYPPETWLALASGQWADQKEAC
ncbi:hypothetical protein IF129_10370 [Streptomyces chumphonensis]|uniref:Uncharacterized protein n=1 Tax=Streptomyces chumphonensis TaxID=1214925 RepID=A0A927EXU0_9ACTN|nr:hypothetical protein [Streptomyces chumphonensis]